MTTYLQLEGVREASRILTEYSPEQIDALLRELAHEIESSMPALLEANAADLSRMDESNPKYDRLKLTDARLRSIAADMANVASLPSPLGRVLSQATLPNGLRLERVSVPFGVIGVIYEARPNVTFDVFSLCLKAGSACVLKGGSDAECSNRAAIQLIHRVLRRMGFDERVASLLPSSHQATEQLLNARGMVDLIIPRGGSNLIRFVRDNSKVPVIETGAGVCHTYFDAAGNVQIGADIVCNGKTRRVSVCNALDCLLICRNRIGELSQLCAPLARHNVEIYADDEAFAALSNTYPLNLLTHAQDHDFGREFLDYKMAVRVVADVDEAIRHIARYGSGHSESIISDDEVAANRFCRLVDAACVYVNAPTSFTDGAQFGLGAEIGISTQKLHARGPMALQEITTYKWLIHGNGQIRQ
ncbi:MAG: glutamate-5-semialdehyde dehydrogenase [Muribaculaceae bacterium]